MHDSRYRKLQAPAEFLCFHVGLHWDQHWGCAFQQEYGTDAASPKAGFLLGLPHTEVVLLSPSGGAALLLHATSMSSPQGRHKSTSLQTPSSCSLLQAPPYLWAHFRRSVVPCCHTAQGCPTPGVNPNAIPMGNKTSSPSWLSQHWNRALQSSKVTLWLFLSLATDHNDQYPMCTGHIRDGKGKSLSNSSPGKEEWNFLPSVWTSSFGGYCKFQQ